MGASGWSYFIPYQQDINKALQELKEEVFQKGQYKQPFDPDEAERDLDFLASIYRSLPNEARKPTHQFFELAHPAGKQRRTRRAVNSINELLEQCGEDGTHSILDIEKVSSTPGFGMIAPLSREKLIDIFGTEQPTHALVEKWSNRVEPPTAEALYKRWEGIYILIYQDHSPAEIYFEGASGD